jgi:hypothetical protein
MPRFVATLALACGLFLALPGCANKPPSENKGDKKTDNTTSTPPLSINADPNAGVSPDTSNKIQPLPTPIAKVDLDTGVGKEATDFLRELRNAYIKPNQLSSSFVKAIGVPIVFPADKTKGFSVDAAEGLLKRVPGVHGMGLLGKSKQIGDVALFQASLIGEPGEISLRMVLEGGAWKVDWLSLSSVDVQSNPLNTSNAETVCQEFTIAAVMGLLTDKDALGKEDRTVLLAAGLTPALKKKWAEPLDSDKAEGFDYNRGSLTQKCLQLGAGVESLAFTQQSNAPVYLVELTRKGGTKAVYQVKLQKGAGPGQWLVDDVTPQ